MELVQAQQTHKQHITQQRELELQRRREIEEVQRHQTKPEHSRQVD
jgi:hypothetical protein